MTELTDLKKQYQKLGQEIELLEKKKALILVPGSIQFVKSDKDDLLLIPDKKHFLYYDEELQTFGFAINRWFTKVSRYHLVEVTEAERKAGRFYFISNYIITDTALSKITKYCLYLGQNLYVYISKNEAGYYPLPRDYNWSHWYEVRRVEE